MSVLKNIKSAQLVARKAKDKFRAGILTALMSEVAIIGKNQGIDETLDVDALKVITKFKKGVGETIDLLSKGGADSKELETFIEEVDIYNEFLPTQMSEKEIKIAIDNILEGKEKSPKLMGMVMGGLQKSYGGTYDGSIASKLVKAALV